MLQAGRALRPRRDGDVGRPVANRVEQVGVAEPEQFDPRRAGLRREGVEQPSGRVVEADGDPDPTRLTAADPAGGEHRPLDVAFDVAGAGRQVFAGRREPQRPAERLRQRGTGAPLGLGQSVAGRRRAQVERTRRIAEATELLERGEQLQVRTIERHMHSLHQLLYERRAGRKGRAGRDFVRCRSSPHSSPPRRRLPHRRRPPCTSGDDSPWRCRPSASG